MTDLPRYHFIAPHQFRPVQHSQGDWVQWGDVSARLQQLEQEKEEWRLQYYRSEEEKATLQSLLKLKKGSVAKLLEVQQRIAIVIGDTPPAEHVDYTLPSLVAFVVQEHDEAVAALAETRDALHQLTEASKVVIAWFEALKQDQHEKLVLNQTLDSASKNWETLVTPSLDFEPLMNAIAKAEPLAPVKDQAP